MLARIRSIFLLCSGGLGGKDPDAEWRKQNEAADKNEMYKLLYLNGKGRLVEEYTKVREKKMRLEDFQAFVREHVGKMLYDPNGKPHTITRKEYARYKADMDGESDGTSDAEIMEMFDSHQQVAINHFEEHEACFDLNKRGAIGETILHLCFLNDTTMHREIMAQLLEIFPKLVLDLYEGSVFFGENVLHMGIVNDDFPIVKLLVGRYHARMDQRACGRFFRPHDLKERRAINLVTKSKYVGTAYLGEYPLAFCASLGHLEMYDYLIDQSLRRKPGEGRCHPNAKDSYGNTVVHMAIIRNQKLMFYHAIHHNKMPASYTIQNAAGLTPLQLSFQLGREELFIALLELSSETQWTYGKVAFVAYPLSILDSIDEDGKVNDNSALSVIVENDSIQHLRMLDLQVVDELLRIKWNKYCKGQFLFKLFWALIHLTFLFIAVQLRPPDKFLEGSDGASKMRYVAEVSVIIGCCAKTGTEINEIRSRGSIKDYFESLLDFPTKAMFMIATMLLFACIPLRVLGMEYVESLLVIFIVPLSWSYLLFFFRGHETLGPMVVIFFKMLKGDLVRFALIYFILLAVFAQAFYYLFRGSGSDSDSFSTMPETFISSFIMTVGEFNWQELYECRMPWLAISMFIIFMSLISVLMLNMLIAMMGRTFDIIKDRSRMEWKRQWASIVLNVERSILQPRLARLRKEYSMKIKIKHRQGVLEEEHEEVNASQKNGKKRPELRKNSTIENIQVRRFKRGTRLTHMDSVANIVLKEVDAFALTKDLPHSKAKTKRDVQRKWKSLIRNVVVQQRFGHHGAMKMPFKPRRLDPVLSSDSEVPSVSRQITLPPIGEEHA